MSSSNENYVNWRAGLNLIEQNLYMFEHGLYTDCTFHIGNQQIGAHRFVVARASRVFEAMLLKHKMTEAKTGVVKITDISYQTFKAILRFMYCEEIDCDNPAELFLAADKYEMDSLKLVCVDRMNKSLTVSNVWKSLFVAQTFGHQSVIDNCTKLLQCCTSACISTDEFMEASEDQLVLLLSQEALSLDGEDTLVHFMERWARRQAQLQGSLGLDQDVRHILQPRILPLLRLLTLTPNQLTTSVKFVGWLSEFDKEVIIEKNIAIFPEYLCKNEQPRNWQPACNSIDFPPKFKRVTVSWPGLSKNYGKISVSSDCHDKAQHGCKLIFRASEDFYLDGVVLKSQGNPAEVMKNAIEPCQHYQENLQVLVHQWVPNPEYSARRVPGQYKRILANLAVVPFVGIVEYNSSVTVHFNKPILLKKNELFHLAVRMKTQGSYECNCWGTVGEFMYRHIWFYWQKSGDPDAAPTSTQAAGILKSLIISSSDSDVQN